MHWYLVSEGGWECGKKMLFMGFGMGVAMYDGLRMIIQIMERAWVPCAIRSDCYVFRVI